MEFKQEDCTVEVSENKPRRGMWHTGPNHAWITVTHNPTGQSVTAYGRVMHSTRSKAMAALSLLVEDCEPVHDYRTESIECPDDQHDWRYVGTDRGGSHKGEDMYECTICGKTEYR